MVIGAAPECKNIDKIKFLIRNVHRNRKFEILLVTVKCNVTILNPFIIERYGR